MNEWMMCEWMKNENPFLVGMSLICKTLTSSKEWMDDVWMDEKNSCWYISHMLDSNNTLMNEWIFGCACFLGFIDRS